MEEMQWLIINYTLPKEPSRARVSAWRKLKKHGSVNIGQSMWVLPLSEEAKAFFNDLLKEILHNNGEALVMEAKFIHAKSTQEVVNAFHKARNEEYTEVLEKCADFFKEIEKETQRENYTFAEIEENEYEYNKLMEWFNDIVKRDFFGASLKSTSEQELNKCRQELENFSKKTYERNDN